MNGGTPCNYLYAIQARYFSLLEKLHYDYFCRATGLLYFHSLQHKNDMSTPGSSQSQDKNPELNKPHAEFVGKYEYTALGEGSRKIRLLKLYHNSDEENHTWHGLD